MLTFLGRGLLEAGATAWMMSCSTALTTRPVTMGEASREWNRLRAEMVGHE